MDDNIIAKSVMYEYSPYRYSVSLFHCFHKGELFTSWTYLQNSRRIITMSKTFKDNIIKFPKVFSLYIFGNSGYLEKSVFLIVTSSVVNVNTGLPFRSTSSFSCKALCVTFTGSPRMLPR